MREDYEERFGKGCNVQEIIENLRRQDEETFRKVSDIYEQKWVLLFTQSGRNR